jgi:hypothetical protein
MIVTDTARQYYVNDRRAGLFAAGTSAE